MPHRTVTIGRSEMYELERLAMEVVAIRGVLRAGGNGTSRLVSKPGAPTVQQVLDGAGERLAQLIANVQARTL